VNGGDRRQCSINKKIKNNQGEQSPQHLPARDGLCIVANAHRHLVAPCRCSVVRVDYSKVGLACLSGLGQHGGAAASLAAAVIVRHAAAVIYLLQGIDAALDQRHQSIEGGLGAGVDADGLPLHRRWDVETPHRLLVQRRRQAFVRFRKVDGAGRIDGGGPDALGGGSSLLGGLFFLGR
jgi:hypothetical protein